MKNTLRPLMELLPWVCPVTSQLVLQKDGSLLANYKITGIDVDHPSEQVLEAARDSLDRSCAAFGSGITAFWRVDHRKTSAELAGHMQNRLASLVNEIHLKNLSNGDYFENQHYLSLLSTPQTGIDGLLEKISLHLQNGKSLLRSVFLAAKQMLLASTYYQFHAEQLQEQIKQFETSLSRFEGGNPQLGLQRLVSTNNMLFTQDSQSCSALAEITISGIAIGLCLGRESQHLRQRADFISVLTWRSLCGGDRGQRNSCLHTCRLT